MNQKLKSCCSENKIRGDELIGAYKIFFGTMASEPRIKIINLLRNGKKNVSEIMEETKMDQTFVSHNLARLKKCGFVEIESDGKYRVYGLNKNIEAIMSRIDEHMAGNCVHILRGERDGQ